MKIYFGVLKDGVSFVRVNRKLTDAGITVLRYYPKLKIVKFETGKKITEINFDFFITVEEEKDDFTIQL